MQSTLIWTMELRLRKPGRNDIVADELFQKLSQYRLDEVTQCRTQRIESKEKGSALPGFSEHLLSTPYGEIPVSFFNRNSDKVVFCGQGFQHSQRYCYPLADLYSNFDVVTFDYQWNNWHFLCSPFTFISPIRRLLLNRHQEVSAVVNYFKSKKDYQVIAGHTICYSVYPFLRAQQEAQGGGERLFDKLILDSPFSSLDEICKKLIEDPYLCWEPQVNHTATWFKKALRCLCISQGIGSLMKKYVECAGGSSTAIMSEIQNTPTLFIHSMKNDVLVPPCEFDKLWQATPPSCRYAYLTPFAHVKHMTNNRGFYRFICEHFVENSSISEVPPPMTMK